MKKIDTTDDSDQKQILVDGIDRLTRKLNEFMLENTKALRLIKDNNDRFVEGKIFAYKKCLQLIGVYLE